MIGIVKQVNSNIFWDDKKIVKRLVNYAQNFLNDILRCTFMLKWIDFPATAGRVPHNV